MSFDLNVLIFVVSLEAIFIGIFLLMSANKAEIERDAKELREREKDREKIERDLKLDKKADRQLTEIKRSFKDLEKKTKTIGGLLRKLQKQTTAFVLSFKETIQFLAVAFRDKT